MEIPASLTLRESDYLKTFGLYFITSALGGMLAGAAAGHLLRLIVGRPDSANLITLGYISVITSLIAALVASYYCFRWCLSRLWKRKAADFFQSNMPL